MRKLWLTTVLLVGLILTGCQNQQENSESQKTSSQSTSVQSSKKSSSQSSSTKAKAISADKLFDQAIAKFKADYPKAVITAFSWEKEYNGTQVEVEGQDQKHEYTLVFDQSGKLIRKNRELNDELNWKADAINLAKVISLKTAFAKAKTQASGAVKSADLENDNGTLKWEIKLSHNHQETEITLDAQTGKVLQKEHDD